MRVNKRIFITTADVIEFTGKGHQACYRILREIKVALNKASIKDITFEEYFKYKGITEYMHYLESQWDKPKD